MPKFEIELPETFGVERGGGSVTIKTAEIVKHGNVIAILLENELANKIGDAAAGVKAALGGAFHDGNKATPNEELSEAQLATMAEKATEMMARVRDNLYEGKWTVRRKGGGESDPLARFIRAIIRKTLTPKQKADYKALDNKGRDAMLDKMADELPDEQANAVRATAEAMYKIDRDTKAQMAKLQTAINL